MKLFLFAFFLLSLDSFAHVRQREKLEGRCNGQMEDNTKINFSYYSDYDGCTEKIAGSIKFSSASGLGHHKGKRTFENDKDVYSFKGVGVNSRTEIYRLTFEDSSGNNTGVLDYLDSQGDKKSITVQCVVRDFEYGDCP